MKIISSIRKTVFTLAAAAFLQNIPTAQAQPNPDSKERPQERPRQSYGEGRMNERRPQGGQPGFQPGNQQGGSGMNLMERILTDDQRDSMRQTMEANREKNRAAMEKIREARKALNKAAFEADFKEDVVRAKALEVAKLEAELSLRRRICSSRVSRHSGTSLGMASSLSVFQAVRLSRKCAAAFLSAGFLRSCAASSRKSAYSPRSMPSAAP